MFTRLTEAAEPNAVQSIIVTDVEKGKFELSQSAMERIGFYSEGTGGALDRCDIMSDSETGQIFIARVSQKGVAITTKGKVTQKRAAHDLAKLGNELTLSPHEPIEWMGLKWFEVVGEQVEWVNEGEAAAAAAPAEQEDVVENTQTDQESDDIQDNEEIASEAVRPQGQLGVTSSNYPMASENGVETNNDDQPF